MREWKRSLSAWENTYRPLLDRDPVWSVRAYRIAMFLISVGWKDVERVQQFRVMVPTAAQLSRAIGSVAANIAEGYGRRSPRDRARIYEYALGSLREVMTWYWSARPYLGAARIAVRAEIISELTALIVGMVKSERRRLPGALGRVGIGIAPATHAEPPHEPSAARRSRAVPQQHATTF